MNAVLIVFYKMTYSKIEGSTNVLDSILRFRPFINEASTNRIDNAVLKFVTKKYIKTVQNI